MRIDAVSMNTLLVISILTSILIILILSVLMLIKSSKCHLQSLVNRLKSLPMPVCIINSRTNEIADCNKHFYNFLVGKESDEINEELKNKNINLLDIFEDFEDYLEIKFLSKDKNISIDSKIARIITQDGVKYVNIQFSYFKIGFKKNIILFFNDITEEIKSFRYLGVFTSIAENTNDGILISKKNGNSKLPKIIYSNSKLTEITGYKKEEILNKPINTIFELNVDESILNSIKEKVMLLEHSELKFKYTGKNGKEYWLHTNIIPVTNQDIKQSLKNVLNNSNNKLIDYINKLDNGDVFIVLHQTDLNSIQSNI